MYIINILTMSLLLLIVSAVVLVTSGTPTPEPNHTRLELTRLGCENCLLENGQRVSFICKLSPCPPGRFSVGIYRIHHSGPVAIHTNTSLSPGGPVVNVTELESSEENTCGRVLTLFASDSLHGTVLQCIATGYSHHLFSVAVAVALEGHFEVDRETTKKEDEETKEEDDRIDCGCPDNCTTNNSSDLTSVSCHHFPNAVLIILALALILSLTDLC